MRTESSSFTVRTWGNRTVVLSPNEMGPQDPACRLCGFAGARRRIIALQQGVDLLECPSCYCRSASRMPRPEVLHEFYSTYYQHLPGTSTFDGSPRFAQHLFQCLGVSPGQHLRLLDFGGGVDATLSRALSNIFIEHGSRRTEIDLIDYNAKCRTDWGQTTVTCHDSLTTVQRETYDVVVASAIIEHLPEPRPALIDLLECLRPAGSAYFRTPALSAIAAVLARLGIKLELEYPAHCHDMGQRFWESILHTLGVADRFSIVRSRPSIVETEFRTHPIPTITAYAAKAPWYVLRRAYPMVGGWEVVIRRN